YYVWLSEIMLQQTQVATVVDYFQRFLVAFPTVEALAAAPLDDVLKLWEGLGYYSRARHLHRAAQIVVSEGDGRLPESVEALQTLPGIGRYTAGAIASLAFGQDAPVVDGNVARILARVFDIADEINQPATMNTLWDLAAQLIPTGAAGPYNEALMELGRLICRPRGPLCEQCPVQAHCRAYALGIQAERPVRKRRQPTPHYDVAAGVIYGRGEQAGRILIAQRPAEGLLGGLWEFPGGKQEDGESLPEALARELDEELAIVVEVGDFLVQVKHAFTHFRITLHAFACQHVGGEPQRAGVADYAWVTLEDMDRYAFGRADQQIIAELREQPRRLL
ncbi:MAG: A/G-specific adenine glycosylase, partial [Anaerolineae bacterium]|nr:A/G-specific adenine glycosylase [Anaerolineae bacterium]